MDIMLEALLGYVDEIASLVSSAAPQVWEMLLLQTRVEAVGEFITAFVCFLLALSSILLIRKESRQGGEYGIVNGNSDGLSLATLIYGIPSVIVAFLSLYEGIARLINPAWYAIKLLISQAGG